MMSIAEVIGLPDHEESWIDDQVYLHRSDDEAIANYSKARRLQEARPQIMVAGDGSP